MSCVALVAATILLTGIIENNIAIIISSETNLLFVYIFNTSFFYLIVA
jgi:hypothetical protein